MKLTVNDRPIDAGPEDGRTLESLLEGLRGRGEIRSDEVVVELSVDSRPWQADDMDGLATTLLADISELAIATDDLRGYARRILSDSGRMLGVLEQAVPHVADQFRCDPPEKANESLFNLLNALQQFLVCLYQVRNTCALQSDPLDPSGGLLQRTMSCLERIQACQEAKNWTGLAAALDDDLLPALRGFEGALQDMIDEA